MLREVIKSLGGGRVWRKAVKRKYWGREENKEFLDYVVSTS